MASRVEDIGEYIAGLSELMAAARKTLAELGDDDNSYTELRRANLRSTITTVQRELAFARQSLQGAHDRDAAATTLAMLKTQAMEGRLAARSGQPRTHTQQALDRTTPSDAIKAILTSASTRAKDRRPRAKKKPPIP